MEGRKNTTLESENNERKKDCVIKIGKENVAQ